MSTFVDFDRALFFIERRQGNPATVGHALVGRARVGRSGPDMAAWVEVAQSSAFYNYSGDYTPNDEGTLIYGAQTATLTLSYYGEAKQPLFPYDAVRTRYGSKILNYWTVDTTTRTRVGDPSADNANRMRTDFTATLVGPYAAALNKTICLGPLPKETAAQRLARYGVTIVPRSV